MQFAMIFIWLKTLKILAFQHSREGMLKMGCSENLYPLSKTKLFRQGLTY